MFIRKNVSLNTSLTFLMIVLVHYACKNSHQGSSSGPGFQDSRDTQQKLQEKKDNQKNTELVNFFSLVYASLFLLAFLPFFLIIMSHQCHLRKQRSPRKLFKKKNCTHMFVESRVHSKFLWKVSLVCI